MKLYGQRVMIVAGMLCASLPVAAERRAPVMVLRMKDGSNLTAVVESPGVPLATDYGKVTIPIAMLGALRSDPESAGVRVEVTNGDRLSGRITSSELRVRNALGRLSVPWREVAELGVCEDSPTRVQLTDRPKVTTPIRFEVFLRDGSCLLGTPQEGAVPIHCVLGKCPLPWALVRSVTFHDDHETCTVRFWSGDSLVGCLDWKACPLATGVGAATISTVTTSRIDVSLGGIDLVDKPYASASGNRYFMGGVKNTQPKRIGGRLRPASQFIEAHASGRIEFEFDKPITEFRALATMYESYCAHKGRVIFKVETEHGPVHATRSLRNLEREEIYARFAPAKRLILITDQNGSADEDWSVWLWPEAR
jgi:hypothetical protein